MNDEKMNIPMRTMIVSTIFTINIFIGLLVVFFGAKTFDSTTWITIVFVIGNFINAIRNPIICMFSHRVNSENRREGHGYKERERKREREILAAKRSREARKKRILLISQSSEQSSSHYSTKYSCKSVQTDLDSELEI